MAYPIIIGSANLFKILSTPTIWIYSTPYSLILGNTSSTPSYNPPFPLGAMNTSNSSFKKIFPFLSKAGKFPY